VLSEYSERRGGIEADLVKEEVEKILSSQNYLERKGKVTDKKEGANGLGATM